MWKLNTVNTPINATKQSKILSSSKMAGILAFSGNSFGCLMKRLETGILVANHKTYIFFP